MVHTSGSHLIRPVNRIRYLAMPFIPLHMRRRMLSLSVIIAYYNIGDRGTRSFKQLTELFAGNGMIGYVAKERVDGKLILPEAVQILKLSGSSKG